MNTELEQECQHEETEPALCEICGGCGEGMHDKSTCLNCGGNGDSRYVYCVECGESVETEDYYDGY